MAPVIQLLASILPRREGGAVRVTMLKIIHNSQIESAKWNERLKYYSSPPNRIAGQSIQLFGPI